MEDQNLVYNFDRRHIGFNLVNSGLIWVDAQFLLCHNFQPSIPKSPNPNLTPQKMSEKASKVGHFKGFWSDFNVDKLLSEPYI